MSNPKSRTTTKFCQCPSGSNIRNRIRRNTVRMLEPGHWRSGLLSLSVNDRKSVAKTRDEMPRILMTGASGGIGTALRKLLPPIYPDLLLSDLKAPVDLGKNEKFKAAELSDLAQVEAICDGVDGILHFGGYSVEGPWEDILQSNIIGGYNLFEAARKKGVKRIVFASSNHAVGFYERTRRFGSDVAVRPDSRYGVSKAFGEALGALYADKHGIGVLSIRIGNFADAPVDER